MLKVVLMLWVSGLIVSIGFGCAVWREWFERSGHSDRKPGPSEDVQAQKKSDLTALMQNDLAALSKGTALNESGSCSPPPADNTVTELAAQPPGSGLHIIPYDPQNEDLLVVWDDRRRARPKVTVLPDTTNPSIAAVSLDNKLVARVATDWQIVAQRVCMMPRSRAARFGWATH